MQRLTIFLLMLVLSIGSALNSPSPVMAGAQAVHYNDARNVQLVGHMSNLGFAWDVAVTSKYAYIASSGNGIDVFDISEPSLPVKVGGYTNPPRYSNAVIVLGTYAYISEGNLRILSLADPAAPTAPGFYQTAPSYIRNMALQANYLYVVAGPRFSNDYGYLYVFDVSNPAAPAKVGELLFRPGAYGIAVSGAYAYVAGAGGLEIINISNPAAPVKVGSYSLPSSSVIVAGTFAYVSTTDSFSILDVSNPSSPYPISSLAIPGARDIALTANYAYVTAGFNGLRVVNISDKTRPVEVGYYDTLGSAQNVTVQDDLVYVADGDGGVYILRYQPPVQYVTTSGGGSFTSNFDRTSYMFAPATFSEAVSISHALRLPGEAARPHPLVGINHFFENSAIGQASKQEVSPTKPYTITVQYTDAEKGIAIEETLALYFWKEGRWIREQSSVVNSSANTITAQPSSFGWWAILGETHRTYLPILGR